MSQSGILRLKLAFGSSSARSAFSRNRAPKKPVCSSLFLQKGLDVFRRQKRPEIAGR